MKKYDLINGPISKVGNDFIRCEEDISPKLCKGNIAFQTAVRTGTAHVGANRSAEKAHHVQQSREPILQK